MQREKRHKYLFPNVILVFFDDELDPRSLPTTDGMRIPVDDQETITNIIQYIIIVNISYLADQGVPKYLHRHLDKYRKKTLYIDRKSVV